MFLIEVDGIEAQPWKNGGGSTRELYRWPLSDAWQLRVSLAEIERDGPFSSFPGVRRWFAVVEGQGVALRFENGEKRVTTSSDPVSFDGIEAPDCALISGPTRDLNLMLRAADGLMQRARYGVPWTAVGPQCGIFTMKPGVWSCGGLLVDMPPRSLLWMESSPTASQLFKADSAGSPLAWWMAFTPAG
jgi:uncharacterized protein